MPYLFQRRIVKAIVKRVVVDEQVCIFEIPTGTGKSVMINLAAHSLLLHADVKKVFVVSATPFLSSYGFENYSLKIEGTDSIYPEF